MPKILFLLGKYFPKSSANGVCCKNIVDECKRQGMDITCVINGDVTRPNHEFIDGVEVFRIAPRLYYRMLDWCEYNPKSKWVKILKRIAGLLNKVQLGIMSSFWPFVSPMYTYRFYRQGKKLLEHGDYSILVAAYTPIDSAYAGYLLKKKFPSIKYVPYYLDALAGGWGPSRWSKKRIEKHTRRWETKLNSAADVVISMQSAMNYHKNNPLTSVNRIFLDVPTFVLSNTQPAIERTDRDKVIALYAGSINYPQRNPVPLLEAFASFDPKYGIQFHLVGPCNCVDLIEKYTELTNGRIRYLGSMSHDEVLKEESEADFLINLGVSNPNTIPCKIFEYMQFRKPIIASKSIDDEAALPYLKQYGSSFIFDEREDTQKSHNDLLQYIRSNPKIAELDYSKVFYKNTPQAFCDIIRQLT